ncbi:hypothetical protein ACFQ0M_44915 [Kitasatospora aburaviensis]
MRWRGSSWRPGAGRRHGRGLLTNRQETARSALSAFREALKPRSLAATATGPAPSGTPSEPTVGFRVKAEFEGAAGAWEYDGALSVVRAADGRAVVRWAPNVIHPHLDTGETIGVRLLPTAAAKPTDRNGKPLDAFPRSSPYCPRSLRPPVRTPSAGRPW